VVCARSHSMGRLVRVVMIYQESGYRSHRLLIVAAVDMAIYYCTAERSSRDAMVAETPADRWSFERKIRSTRWTL